jgi:hypothetical protein
MRSANKWNMKRDNIAYVPFFQFSADFLSRLLKKKGIHKIKKQFNKMAFHLGPPRQTSSGSEIRC